MLFSSRNLLIALTLLTPTILYGQVNESSIKKEIKALPATPDAAALTKISTDIRSLPAGNDKVKLADELAHLVTPGEMDIAVVQSGADTLAQALTETPQPAKKDVPPEPYLQLAKMARYKAAKVTLNDPLYAKATSILVANEADVEKVDFTLKDLKNNKVTLSQFRGKFVIVNFTTLTCPACMKELPDLDVIYTHLEPQGVVVLTLAPDDTTQLNTTIVGAGYHPTVLADSGSKVAKQFHVDGVPRDFVFDKTGKLAGESMDYVTQHQLLIMLANAGLKP